MNAYHIIITQVTGALWDLRVYEGTRMFLGAFYGTPKEVRELLRVFRLGAKARESAVVVKGLDALKLALSE